MPIHGGPQVERGNSGLGFGEGAEGCLQGGSLARGEGVMCVLILFLSL